jgi:hypothetical protein
MVVVSALPMSTTLLIEDFRFFVECRMGRSLPSSSTSTTDLAIPEHRVFKSQERVQSEPDSTNGSRSNHLRPPTDKKVLVVEDNIINQTVLKRQLTKAGYDCEGKSPIQDHNLTASGQ